MIIKLQMSDKVYSKLVSSNCRVQGTIGLINPTEGNFNEHARQSSVAGSKFIKLRHGRASVGNERVRLTLSIGLDEADIIPSEAITHESLQASDFIDNVLDDTFGY